MEIFEQGQLIRMQRPDGIDPALIEDLSKYGAALWLNKRVLDVGLGPVDIEIGWHDVVVAGKYDGHSRLMKISSLRAETLQPSQFVVELRPRLGLPFGA